MIRLASLVWKRDTLGTLQRLVDSKIGLPEMVLSSSVIKDYIRDHVKYDQCNKAFWQQCQQDHLRQEEQDIRRLQRDFNCLPTADWVARGGQFLGSSDATKVSTFMHERAKFPTRYQLFKQHHSRQGPKWRGVLVFPYYDLPGRIRGFVVIGRSGDIQIGDWFYAPLGPPVSTYRDAGLGMLDTLLLGKHPQFGHTGFIFTDPLAALQLQMRHMREHHRPLPLATTWSNELVETGSLDWLAHDDLIFWGCGDKIEPIMHARRRNAKVSMTAVTTAMLAKNLRHYSATEWLSRIKENAAPWQTALQMELEELSGDQVEGTFGRIGLHGQELSNFIAGCREPLRQRLLHLQKHSIYAKSVSLGGKEVRERDGCWWWVKRGQADVQLTNAIVRIDHCLTTRGSRRRSYYKGLVRFNDKEYPFTERVEALDAGLFTWTMTFLRDRLGVGVPEFLPGWNGRGLQLAIAFHEPKMVTGVEAIGWDAENLQFHFPKFSLRRDGSVTDEFSCLFDDDKVPGRHIPAPGAIPVKHMAALSEDNEESRIFWGMAAHVASTLMCPVVNRVPTGLLLDGSGAQSVGTSAAQRLGSIAEAAPRGAPPADFLYQLVGRHHYPAVVTDMPPGPWLELPEARYTITSLPFATNRVLAARGTWNMLSCERKLGSLQFVAAAAANVLPNYLQDVYQRGLLIGDQHPDFISNVLDDMADWFRRIGGAADTVLAANQHLVLPGTFPAWKHFIQLAFHLYADGKLTFTRAEFDDAARPKSALVEINHQGKPMMWISQDRFSEAVKDAGSLPPDLLLTTKSLTDAGVLLSEPVYREDRGWLVSNEWWNENLKSWRNT